MYIESNFERLTIHVVHHRVWECSLWEYARIGGLEETLGNLSLVEFKTFQDHKGVAKL